jgi:hypothetical protein
MYGYNVIAIREDRATLGSDPSAPIAATAWGGIFNGDAHLQMYAGANNGINPLFFMR